MRLICPAAFGLPPRAVAARLNRRLRRRALAAGLAHPVTLTPPDDSRVRLDALCLGAAQPQARPMLVVCVGFAMSYEAILPAALNFAQALDLQLLLYNGRGVGLSSGRPTSPSDLVADGQAALTYALARAPTVAAYGISMGAAWMLLAAQALAAAGPLQARTLGLLVAARAFCRLADVPAAHLGPAAGAAARRLMLRAGFLPLDLIAALQRPLPAERVLITQAAADRLVPPTAQLGPALQLRAHAWSPLPCGRPAFYLPSLGHGHVDRRFRNRLHDQIIGGWAGQAGGQGAQAEVAAPAGERQDLGAQPPQRRPQP